jgi:hypothetical protein
VGVFHDYPSNVILNQNNAPRQPLPACRGTLAELEEAALFA